MFPISCASELLHLLTFISKTPQWIVFFTLSFHSNSYELKGITQAIGNQKNNGKIFSGLNIFTLDFEKGLSLAIRCGF